MGTIADIIDATGLSIDELAQEPDQYHGYCEECDTGSVRSVLAMLGMI